MGFQQQLFWHRYTSDMSHIRVRVIGTPPLLSLARADLSARYPTYFAALLRVLRAWAALGHATARRRISNRGTNRRLKRSNDEVGRDRGNNEAINNGKAPSHRSGGVRVGRRNRLQLSRNRHLLGPLRRGNVSALGGRICSAKLWTNAAGDRTRTLRTCSGKSRRACRLPWPMRECCRKPLCRPARHRDS